MKLLTVAYNYPPIRGPEAIQANRLIKYASELNLDFDIVTRHIGKGKKFKNNLTQYGNVYRSFSLDNFYIKGALRVFGNDLENFPDAERLWYPFALRKAESLIKKNRYDYIYTRSVPFTSHLVGLQLKKKYGLPWIAHFSDPWTDSPYVNYKKEITRNKNLEWEREVILNADKLIFTSQETIELIMRKYDDALSGKAYVLPHSYDPESIENTNSDIVDPKPYRLSYIGNFYGKRSPEDLFKAIELAQVQMPGLDKYINFHFFGKMPGKYLTMISQLNINKLVFCHGEIPYHDSQKEMARADVLINIDAPSDTNVFLPSKIIEYLAYEKPILAITPDKGTVNRILSEYGHICVQNNNYSLLNEILLRIVKEGVSWVRFNKDAKDDYHPAAVADRFIKIITG